MTSGTYIAAWIVANLLAVGVYDLIAWRFLPVDQSVSYWVQRWSQEFPVFTLGIGIVLGHLFWPLHRTNGGPHP